ncbi:MAG: rRNA pseudouridine synthase [Clostridia bacterium]|nr:rRNA pseudouridine synthase [Clostridia bacterium]
MRIDKLLTTVGAASRTEAAKAAKRGEITVNGVPVRRADVHVDPDRDVIVLRGEPIVYKEHVYIMLNKPDGYVSATDDPREKTVLELLPEKYRRLGLFPCGRLDKNTLGLIILTNDGEGAHRVLSPKHHVGKTYRYMCADPLTDVDIDRLASGITLDDGYVTKDAVIRADDGRLTGEITLTEGKYHQIKRMFAAVNNKITYLERISFGHIILDPDLERGQWRELNKEEEALFKA